MRKLHEDDFASEENEDHNDDIEFVSNDDEQVVENCEEEVNYIFDSLLVV